MDILKTLERIRSKRQNRMDDDGWVTINGTHVLIEDDHIVKGPRALKERNAISGSESESGKVRTVKTASGEYRYSNQKEYDSEKKRSIENVKKAVDSEKQREAEDARIDKDEYIQELRDQIQRQRKAMDRNPNKPNFLKNSEIVIQKLEAEIMRTEAHFQEKYGDIGSGSDDYGDSDGVLFDAEYEYRHIEANTSKKDADAKIINPNGTMDKCYMCAVAYEMRARGLDVCINDKGDKHRNSEAQVLECFKGAEKVSFDGVREDMDNGDVKMLAAKIRNQMKQWGGDSRALLIVHRNNSGHILNLVGGSVRDAQNGTPPFTNQLNNIAYKVKYSNRITLVRVDNAELTGNVKDYVREVE